MNSIRIDERPIVAIGLDIDGVINIGIMLLTQFFFEKVMQLKT